MEDAVEDYLLESGLVGDVGDPEEAKRLDLILEGVLSIAPKHG